MSGDRYAMSLLSDTAASDADSVFGDAEDNATGQEQAKPASKDRPTLLMKATCSRANQRKSKKHKRDSKEDEDADDPVHSCVLAGESLNAVKKIVEDGIGKVLSQMESKFEAFEKRIEILEVECFERSSECKVMHEKLVEQEATIRSLSEQVESMETNRRMNTLILKCQDFGVRKINENIEAETVKVINKRFPELKISGDDFQTVHRLQGEKTVICKFLKTDRKNELYEKRLSRTNHSNSRSELAPLFINESLSPANQAVFNALLEAKRQKCIYTVYTKRGSVFCKQNFESPGRRIYNMDQVKTIFNLQSPGAGQPQTGRSGAPVPPIPGAAPARPAGRSGFSARGGSRVPGRRGAVGPELNSTHRDPRSLGTPTQVSATRPTSKPEDASSRQVSSSSRRGGDEPRNSSNAEAVASGPGADGAARNLSALPEPAGPGGASARPGSWPAELGRAPASAAPDALGSGGAAAPGGEVGASRPETSAKEE